MNQSLICTLFGKSKSTISEHIKNILNEGELDAIAKNYLNEHDQRVESRCYHVEDQALRRKQIFLRQ